MRTWADPGPGRTLQRFVDAARRRDTNALWAELSAPTRAGLGGSRVAFRREFGAALVRSLGRVRPSARIVMSRQVAPAWGVAALAGPRTTPDGLEDFAYAAALRQEAGEWRVDLGGVLVGGVRPEPLHEVEGDVRLRADTAAGRRVRTFLLWLDGRPVAGRVESPTPFSGRVVAEVGRPATGRHVAVAFAATDSGAGAVAWPFRVTG